MNNEYHKLWWHFRYKLPRNGSPHTLSTLNMMQRSEEKPLYSTGEVSPVLACRALSQVPVLCGGSHGWVQHAPVHLERVQSHWCQGESSACEQDRLICTGFQNFLSFKLPYFLSPRMASHGQFVSSSSQTGPSKECQSQEKDLLILLAKCIKLKNSLARTGQLLCTAGKV